MAALFAETATRPYRMCGASPLEILASGWSCSHLHAFSWRQPDCHRFLCNPLIRRIYNLLPDPSVLDATTRPAWVRLWFSGDAVICVSRERTEQRSWLPRYPT